MNPKRHYSIILFDLLILSAIEVFMMVFLDVRYLFLDTIVTGGDTASWQGIADHMMKVLLPQGRLSGWDMGNFCGYPNFSFYFIPPFLLASLSAYLLPVPLTIALKCVIALGIFLLPVMTYFGLRAMSYRFPIPAIGASASLLFLFNESYTMFGGNVVSTLTGEFCYMLAFALFAYFIGSLYRGVTTGSGVVKNGILLGLIGLTHLFVFIPAVCLLVYWFLAEGKLRYLFNVSLIAFGLMAFWILPLMAYRDPFTTPVYMIWQPFVNWRYAFLGIGLGLVFMGPRLAIAALSFPSRWGLPLICSSGLGVFTLIYLAMNYFGMGPGFWDTGLEMTPQSASPVGEAAGSLLNTWAVPLGLCLSVLVTVIGLRARKIPSRFEAFCAHAGALAFLAVLMLAALGMYSLAAKSIPQGSLKTFLLGGTSFALLGAVIAGGFLLFYRRFTVLLVRVSLQRERDPTPSAGLQPEAVTRVEGSQRFTMFLALVLGCVVGYFSAHFLQIPDIRFLPPLLFSLMLILSADTLASLLDATATSTSFWSLCRNVIFESRSRSGARNPDYAGGVISRFFPSVERTEKHASKNCDTQPLWRGKWAVLILYGCVVAVIFGTSRADNWFRFNNMGYESMPGYGEFRKLNDFLRQAYKARFADPLNAPRVGYEKSDLYGRYGGDRVFESLTFFSGRQTLEGIHYASSIASKPIAFLQTAYSRDIKTPVPYILSRINPAGLPAYFDLYNISQLILVSDEAKKAIQTSSLFDKEADFGPLSVYRYRECQGLYVDVPKLQPVLYTGKNWVKDFFQWYKMADRLDVPMVPASYLTSGLDRDILSLTISNLDDLRNLERIPLDREGLNIKAHLEPFRIRFKTNKVGVPHLIKVSYFPNWNVQGAEAVYPVSPHLMLVIPREREVVLTYGRTLWDYAGIVITLGTLLFLLLAGLARVKRLRSAKRGSSPHDTSPPPLPAAGGLPSPVKGEGFHSLSDRGGETETTGGLASRLRGNDSQEAFSLRQGKVRSFLIILVLLCAAGLIIAGAILRNTPVRSYVNGHQYYQMGNDFLEAKKVEEANRCFRRAIEAMAPIVDARHSYDHQDVIHCMLFTAMSFERLGEWGKAETVYSTILQDYPYSRYVGECYVKIARGKKVGRDLAFEEALTAFERGDQAQALPLLKKTLDQTEHGLAFLRRAIAEDPYSVWAKYATQDLEAERLYLESKLPLVRALCDDAEVLRTLSSVCSENPFGFQ